MTKLILLLVLSVGSLNVHAMSSSGGAVYTDIECDMTDLTCYKLIMEMGRQDAITHLMNGSGARITAELRKAIDAYKLVNNLDYLADEDVILLLVNLQ